MLFGNMEIPLATLNPHYAEGVEAFRTEPAYAELAARGAEASHSSVHGSRGELAALMPVVQFAINTTLAAMKDPAVAPRLPLEVTHRSMISQEVMRQMIGTAQLRGIFTSYYLSNADLRPLYLAEDSAIAAAFHGTDKEKESLWTLGEAA